MSRQVGGRKTQTAPPLIPECDPTCDQMRTAEYSTGLAQIALGQCVTDAGARVRPLGIAMQALCRGRHAEGCSNARQRLQVPGAPLAKAKVLTHDDQLGAQLLLQDLLTKLLRRKQSGL